MTEFFITNHEGHKEVLHMLEKTVSPEAYIFRNKKEIKTFSDDTNLSEEFVTSRPALK